MAACEIKVKLCLDASDFERGPERVSALGQLNIWRAESAKLPAPNWIGERTISPAGVPFRVVRDGGGVAWQPCVSGWIPSGFSFRSTDRP